MKKLSLWETCLSWSVILLYGLFFGYLFWVMVILGWIIVKHLERLPRLGEKGMLVVANHPALIEPFLIPLALMKYWWHNWQHVPFSMPDFKNFIADGWSFVRLIQVRIIPIVRGDAKSAMTVPRRVARALKGGGIVIIHPEEGRTSTATKKGKKLLRSRCGHPLGELSTSVGFVALVTGATVLTIWINDTDKIQPGWGIPWRPWKWTKISFTLGKPFVATRNKGVKIKTDAKRITIIIQNALLDLADENPGPVNFVA